MGKLRNLIDNEYGLLKVRSLSEKRTKDGGAIWVCDCKCGNKDVLAIGSDLVRNKRVSCGCVGNLFRKAKKLPRLTNSESLTKICEGCKQEFTITYKTDFPWSKRFINRKKLCDICALKKKLGTRPSKDDW